MYPSFQEVIDRLSVVASPAEPLPSKRAAVAISLRLGVSGPEMLMIQRAVREGDPWSGHMGFPGGRKDASDATDVACAKRETLEEIGFDLDTYGELICQLSDVNTGWRADRPEMLVAPFIFKVDSTPDFELNHEVDDTLWVPLSFLLDDANRSRHQWDWRGEVLESDAFTYDNRLIWGLSLMMIDELLEIIDGRAAGLESTSARVTRA
ncbi:MAG: NUDIX domain-containing protein [Gammaproteobacteria bacterium]|nr:NUDIX domain-containing protein [Gammaproteobacteria bacterium]